MREVGPLSAAAPAFLVATVAMAPCGRSPGSGSGDFTPLVGSKHLWLPQHPGDAELTRAPAALL